uniref:Uncharacterized protein n=1 Tax=Arundo donax TaxID=35708 RepID=A0A0A9BUE5_ARUDO
MYSKAPGACKVKHERNKLDLKMVFSLFSGEKKKMVFSTLE